MWTAGKAAFGRRVAKIPMTKDEIKTAVFRKYQKDEIKAIKALSTAGSEAGRIFCHLQLTRDLIGAVMRELVDDRRAQTTFCSIVCATRYKFFCEGGSGGCLQPTVCLMCKEGPGTGSIDSFDHMLACIGLGAFPENAEFVLDYLRELSIRASKGNPGYTSRFWGDPEILLDTFSDSSLQTLSFERDTNSDLYIPVSG